MAAGVSDHYGAVRNRRLVRIWRGVEGAAPYDADWQRVRHRGKITPAG